MLAGAPEPEVVLSGHQTGPEYRPNLVGPAPQPGQQAETIEENGEAVNVPQQNEQPAPTSAPIEQAPERAPAEQAEPNVPVAQTPERGIPEAQPQPSAQTLPNREDLRESPPVRPETYTPGEKPVRWTKAQAAWEEEQRQQAIEEANETARGRSEYQSDLLTSIQKSGGLPTPKRLAELAGRGENLTGEMESVYAAWKGLNQDTKNWLNKQGIYFTKLFRNDALPLDEMRGNLGQHAGFNYEQVGDLLAEAENAMMLARERKLGLARRNRRGRAS